MKKPASTGADAPTLDNTPNNFGVPDIIHITQRIWEHAADDLSQEELEWFSLASDEAVRTSSNLAKVINGIGCLVADDDGPERCTGCFQSAGSTSVLLFFIAQSVDHIGAMIEIGDAAKDRLLKPELYRMLAKARK